MDIHSKSRKLLGLIVILLIKFSTALAQINVSVSLDPRFTPKLADFQSLDFSYVNVSISNVGTRTYNVTFYAELKGNNGVKINTKLKPKPTGEALVLNPGEFRNLTGSDIEELFKGSTLDLNGLDYTKIAQTGNIPEGIYQICLQAFDNDNLEPLSSLELGCSPEISIQSAEPPQIITVNGMGCGEDIEGALQLNTMFITWTPTLVIGATQPQYNIKIYELLNEATLNDNQVFSQQNPILNETVTAPTIVFNPNNYGMLNNTRYIFRIQAIDPTGFNSYRNEGYSASCMFTLRSSEYLDPPIGPISNYSQNITYPKSGDTLPFKWVPIVSEISPNTGRLEEVMTTTQVTFIGMPFDLPAIETFNSSDLGSVQNNNNRYSIVTKRFEPQDEASSGKVFHYSVLHSLTNEGNILPQGAADEGYFTMGMGKPQFTGIRQTGTMIEKEITFIPSFPPERLLPRDRTALIYNENQESNSEIRIHQKLAVEISRVANFLDPQRIAFEEFDFTYNIETVTEQQILSDIYSQRTLDIELPDSGIYFMRLAWLSDPTDESSFSFSWSDIKMVNRDGIGISLCLGVEEFTGVKVGATVCIAGGIPIKISSLDSQNSVTQGWTGSGVVEVPIWGEKFKINFNDMVVDVGGLVTDGSAEAVHSREDLIPPTMTVQQGEQFISNESNRRMLFNETANSDADTAGHTLPFTLNTGLGGAKLNIWKLIFNKENASAFLYYQIPTGEDTLELVSLSDALDLNCNNEGLLRFSLVSDLNIPLPGAETNKLVLKKSGEEPTYVQLSCSGIFNSGRVAGDIILDREYFEPSENEENAGQEFTIPFEAELDENGNFLGAISLPKFHPGGLDYVEIDSTVFVFDFSKTANYSELPPPNNSRGTSYTGFYAKDIECTIKKVFETPNSANSVNQEIKIIADQISISEEDGFNTRIRSNALIPWDANYDWGGWRYSIDTFLIEFQQGELVEGYTRGYIKTPLDTGIHKSRLELAINKHSVSGRFDLGTTIPFNAMNADLTITQTNAQFQYSSNSGMEISLNLDADFEINVGLDGNRAVEKIMAEGRFQGVSFKNTGNPFSIDNIVVDRFKVFQYEMALTERGSQNARDNRNSGGDNSNSGNNNPSNSGGNNNSNTASNNNSGNNSNNGGGRGNSGNSNNSGRTAGNSGSNEPSGVRFVTEDEPNGGKKYMLRFAGRFAVEDYMEVHGAGKIGVRVKPNGDIEPTQPEIEKFGAKGNFGPVSLEGELEFFENHTTYGTGIGGLIGCDMDMMGSPIGLEVQFKSGKKSNYYYWYLQGDASLGNSSIPLGSIPMAINGFGLKVGNNVNFTDRGVTPSRSTAVFGGSVNFISYPDMGATFKIQGGFEASFNTQTYSISQLTILGQVGLMGSNFPSEQSSGDRFNGRCTMTYDFENHVFSANADAYLRAAGGMLRGRNTGDKLGTVDILFSAENWHIMVGRPSWSDGRVGLKIGFPGIADISTSGYFMMGTNLPNTEFPPQVIQKFQREQIRLPEQIQIVSGVAHGASFEVSTGKQEFLIFYGQFDLVVGYDIAFGKTEGCVGRSEIGINNWYASGALYAALNGNVGMHVDIWFYEGNINIASIDAAAVITGGLPNPSYLEGAATGRYNVLNGLVKGRFNFEFSIGEKCEPVYAEAESPVNNLKLIEEVLPAQGTSDISITTTTTAVFRFNHNESFSIEVPRAGDNNNFDIRTFRAKHDFDVFKGNSTGRRTLFNQMPEDEFTRSSTWDGDFYIAKIDFKGFLEPGARYRSKAQSYFEELKGGSWERAKNKAGRTIAAQVVQNSWTTSTSPRIEPFYIESQFPEPNRSFVYTSQINGKINFRRRTGGLFVNSANSFTNIVTNVQVTLPQPRAVKYIVRFTDIENNSVAYSSLNTSPSSYEANFRTRTLDNNKLYKLEIIRVLQENTFLDNYLSDINSPRFYSTDVVNNAMQQSLNLSAGNTGSLTASRQLNIQQMSRGNTMETTEYNGIDIDQLGNNLIERMINSFQDVLYTTYFGTSRYSNLREKIAGVNRERLTMLNFNGGRIMVVAADAEPLESRHFEDPTYNFAVIKPLRNNEYLQNINALYAKVNELIDLGIINRGHISNLYHYDSRTGKMKTATPENTSDNLRPQRAVSPNEENPNYWLTQMKNENWILIQTQQNSTFDRIKNDVQLIKGIVPNIVNRRYPDAANNPTSSTRVNYSAINGSILLKLIEISATNNVDQSVSGNQNWQILFTQRENTHNAVFPSNVVPEMRATLLINPPAAPSKQQSWSQGASLTNKNRSSSKP